MKVNSGEEEEPIVDNVTVNETEDGVAKCKGKGRYGCKQCVRNEERNKCVPEIHFVALLKFESPVRAISVESTLALNPWCFGARVVYVHTPGAHPP